MTYQSVRVLAAIGFCLVFIGGSWADTRAVRGATVSQATTPAVTGTPVRDLQSFDDAMTSLMTKWQVPGAALAVAKDSRLVFAHGYGLADVDLNQPVRPDSLFRIAGLSKTFTAAGILVLVEQGKLDLDAPAFGLLDQFTAPPNAAVDPRLTTITVRELLQHTGGWNADARSDPMFRSVAIAQAMGTQPPANCETTIGYMKGQPLDFDPGTRQAGSNLGYCMLGRIIEKISGQSYEDFIAGQILTPAGISRMRLGHTLPDSRAAGEVHYYGYPGQPLASSVFAEVSGSVPAPYGGFSLEALDSTGGWIASAVDLVKFFTALDGRRPPALLKPQTIRLMIARPAPVPLADPVYYGMGIGVTPLDNGADWWHQGLLSGSQAEMVHAGNGLSWAVVLNSVPSDSNASLREVDQTLVGVANKIVSWPTNDLFAQYP